MTCFRKLWQFCYDSVMDKVFIRLGMCLLSFHLFPFHDTHKDKNFISTFTIEVFTCDKLFLIMTVQDIRIGQNFSEILCIFTMIQRKNLYEHIEHNYDTVFFLSIDVCVHMLVFTRYISRWPFHFAHFQSRYRSERTWKASHCESNRL
jgi:hypothetical protein